MKSRTSSFNKTVFKKDITRFAPAWGIYTIILLLAVVSLANIRHAYFRVQNVSDTIMVMSWINLLYGAIVAQLLFGDLYVGRMCNALHALPLRRESWFATHVASGICFSALPNLAIALIALPALRLESGWTAVFWWLLASELQYLFFFGTAVLCVMLSGNRFGQAALYGIINFAGLLAYWMASAVYEPFLYGIQFSEVPFMRICPLGQINTMSDVLTIDFERIENALGETEYYIIHSITPEGGWGYMAICAAVGIAALICALALYRRRKLECAGDFVAISAMEPVVTVIVTVFAGGVFHMFADAFGMNLRSVMLGAGMVLGFFICRMMLERTTRVFRKKAFLFCGSIIAIFGLTVLLTYLDPAGITRYIPAAEGVESITFSRSYSLHSHQDFPYTAVSEEDIAALQRVHEAGISKQSSVQPEEMEEMYSIYDVRLEYKLKNGKTLNRFYTINPVSEAGQILKDYFSTTDCVLGIPEDQLAAAVPYVRSIYTEMLQQEIYNLDNLDIAGLFEAVAADCRAGNMVQHTGYHYPSNYDLLGLMEIDNVVSYLEIGWDRALLTKEMENAYGTVSAMRYTNLRVYRSCVNTIEWMDENGLLTEEMKKGMEDKYDGAYFAWK